MACPGNRVLTVIAAILLAVVSSTTSAHETGSAIDPRVGASIVASIAARLGASARVDIASIDSAVETVTARALVAVPDPAGRIGRPTRFAITASTGSHGARVRIGQAVAVVSVVADQVRVRRAVTGGHVVEADAVEGVSEELRDAPFRHVPTLSEVIGSRATRDLRIGNIVGETDVVVAPAVRAGDRVRGIVRLGGVEATVSGVAVETGMVGRVIRIVNPQSRRTLLARIVGNGEVEVIHER